MIREILNKMFRYLCLYELSKKIDLFKVLFASLARATWRREGYVKPLKKVFKNLKAAGSFRKTKIMLTKASSSLKSGD